LQRFGFLGYSAPQIRCEVRRRLARDERFDAAIHELAYLSCVTERFAARIAFRSVCEQLWLAFGAKLAERGVG
jgi:hypothetical protein